MKLRSHDGLTFDDVLLVPKRSRIRSRFAVTTRARFSRNIEIAIPLISSNMDTVTESTMAIAMARAGGIGVIHRFMSIEKQANEVKRVKRAESIMVESPQHIAPSATIDDAKHMMAELDIGGLVVLDEHGCLVGLVTTRDVMFEKNTARPVCEVMTPREKLITVQANTSLDDARELLHANRLEKLPVVNADHHLVGLITAQDIVKAEESPDATKDKNGRLRVAVAVGVKSDDLDRAEACIKAGADALVVDIAHGHADFAMDMVRALKQRFPNIDVVGGNIATADGVRDMVEAGADAVKVGVGAGSICITRIVTGFGVPQLTAIADCAEAGHELHIPVIADGGIRTGGDLTKALAAGASTAMIGSLLAGTDESPGKAMVRDGRRVKIVRGMASLSANIDRREVELRREVDPADWEKACPKA